MKCSVYLLDRNCENYNHKLFTSYALYKKLFEVEPLISDYEKVYECEVEATSEMEGCEKVFTLLNIKKPEDYNRRSLSVSDIVEINGNYYYCDNYGFKKL